MSKVNYEAEKIENNVNFTDSDSLDNVELCKRLIEGRTQVINLLDENDELTIKIASSQRRDIEHGERRYTVQYIEFMIERQPEEIIKKELETLKIQISEKGMDWDTLMRLMSFDNELKAVESNKFQRNKLGKLFDFFSGRENND